MAMKSPPGSIYPPADCRDQLQMGSRTRVRDDGASRSSFWKIVASLTFLGLTSKVARANARATPWFGIFQSYILEDKYLKVVHLFPF